MYLRHRKSKPTLPGEHCSVVVPAEHASEPKPEQDWHWRGVTSPEKLNSVLLELSDSCVGEALKIRTSQSGYLVIG